MLRQYHFTLISLLTGIGILMILAAGIMPAPVRAGDTRTGIPDEALAHGQDYTFGFYPYGWRGTDPQGDRIFAVQTNAYGLGVNASQARITRLGPILETVTADEAVGQGKEVILGLPENNLAFSVSLQGVTYEAVSAVPLKDRLLIRRTGRFMQQFELWDVLLKKPDGTVLTDVTAKIGFYCWPDRFSATLSLTPTQAALNDVTFSASLNLAEGYSQLSLWNGGSFTDAAVGAVSASGIIAQSGNAGPGIALINPAPTGQRLQFVSPRKIICKNLAPATLEKSKETTFSVVIVPARVDLVNLAAREIQEIQSPLTAQDIIASATGPVTGNQPVTYDPVAGEYKVLAPSKNNHYSQVERILLHLTNSASFSRSARLHFYKDSTLGGGFSVTGLSPLLRDLSGLPIALPVQISKNWHVNPAWFSGLTMFSLAPGQNLDAEFDLTYANWGQRDADTPLPAVSHAHLCLEGYGGNQQWDQLAIGSFGESICYDPDVNLNRAMGDDIRPLMVRSMDANSPQWTWTNNVGGLDFLVYFKNNEKQFLSRQKTLFNRYCPILTDVTYAGETPDGVVQSRIRTQTWRSDDMVRGLYTLRYDVTATTDNITRLAFFQMGADGYNTNPFSKFARGTLVGLEETTDTAAMNGGWAYKRRGVELAGEQPWFALYEYGVPEKNAGAWANRGIIIRSWKARLGGVDCPHPFYSIYGTVDGKVPSFLVELSPPAALTRLVAGDYVEAVVEVLIVPQFASDYYGPNQNLTDALSAHPDSWETIYREATGNHLEVTAVGGSVERDLPVRIHTEDGKQVRFSITGGVGFVPVTICGVHGNGPFQVQQKTGDQWVTIDQSTSLQRDWWQTDPGMAESGTEITFSLPLDTPGDKREVQEFQWSLLNESSNANDIKDRHHR